MADTKSKKEARLASPPAPTSWSNPFMDLRRRMDHIFDDFTSGLPFSGFHLAGPLSAPVDPLGGPEDLADVKVEVSEDDKEIEVTAEVPGMSEKEVNVEVSGGLLTLSGEKNQDSEKKSKNVYMSERRYGSFRRSFRLPDSVDEAGIAAKFHNGVLKITLPKRPEAQAKTRRIDVKTS